MRMEKIIATVLHQAHERQFEEAADALEEGPPHKHTLLRDAYGLGPKNRISFSNAGAIL